MILRALSGRRSGLAYLPRSDYYSENRWQRNHGCKVHASLGFLRGSACGAVGLNRLMVNRRESGVGGLSFFHNELTFASTGLCWAVHSSACAQQTKWRSYWAQPEAA